MKKIGAMVLCCMFVTTVEAGGFASPNMSASGMGVANAVVAGADDVSAAAYNPAGIAWQDGIQGMVGFNAQYRNSSVDLGTDIAPNNGSVANLNHLYTSWMPRDSDFGLAFAFNRPFEVDNEWSSAFPGTAGRTTIKIDRFSLDAIYRLNSSLAFAVGGDWYLTSASVQAFSASDKASFGGHLSMKWKPAPTWSVGALARLGSNITVSSGAQSLEIKLPDEFTVGIAHDVADAVRLEIDANWSRWSRLDNLNVVPGGAVTTLDMQDSLVLMAGATWFWRENSQFRFGYAYDEGASSSGSTFNPAIADQTGHSVSLGAGGDLFGAHFDIAYVYTFYPENSVTGPFAGTYRDRRHSFALSVSKGF